RIQQLLDRLEEYRLQPLRALEVLERLDTPETQQLLNKLADGAPDAWPTQEAKAINRRLATKRQKSPWKPISATETRPEGNQRILQRSSDDWLFPSYWR